MYRRNPRSAWATARVRWLCALALGLLLGAQALGRPVAAAGTRASVDPAVQATLQAQPAGSIRVIAILKSQANLRAISGRNRADRQKKVIQALRKLADGDQPALRSQLAALKQAGQVQSFTPLWVLNAIAVAGTPAAISQLAASPLVARIADDAQIQAPPGPAAANSAPPEANLSAINVPALWALGYRGQGVVVANLDTGVDAAHPDLAARWRGGANSWFDPYGEHAAPADLNGHGTWTMGVLVGGASGGSAIGVAPDAQWIAAKIYNDSGVATASAIHQSFQWLLDPDNNPATADAPHVVNNSWALSNINGCNTDFQPDLQSLVAAGITPVFAAGNYGPGGSTSVSPANNPEALAIGAVNNSAQIYSSGSRGPTSCGSVRSYPDLVAPGVSVYTTDLFGLYYAPSGTSLAAPHAAGVLALLLGAYPNLTAAQQRDALIGSATDLGAAGADNTFGSGQIDALAAYNRLAGTTLPTPTATAGPNAQPTSTPTDLPTSTPTEAPTSTPTHTPTSTPTPTSTATSTPTNTATSTATSTPTSIPTPPGLPDQIFADGFEGGTLGAWSAASTGGGRLSVSAGAALAGTRGMQAQISSTTGLYVADTSPAAEASYHARFYFTPNGVSMANNTQHDLLIGRNAAGAQIFRLQMRRSSNSYQLRLVVLLNNGSTKASSWYTISNASHAIEIAWQAAGTSSGSTGAASLWLDGAAKQSLAALANGKYRLEEVRLGPSSGLSSTTSGTEYFDAFVSTRTSYIGP